MNRLERPVFILAPPRSGSTLLFETLSRSASLWSLGDEGHGVIERHSTLTPRPFSDDSNRLVEADLTPELEQQIRQDFSAGLRDCKGMRLPTNYAGQVRMLEKTPKNILRIPFILKLFPDALFIYLYRDARENISSIMQGWESGRFTTYMDKQTRHGLWSFLLPPGWRGYADMSLGEVAAFQWAACHEYAMRDLAAVPEHRWCAVNYQEFLANTGDVIEHLCKFIDVPLDDELRDYSRGELPLSRFTLSSPAKNKWQRNAAALSPIMPTASEVSEAINRFTQGQSTPLATDLEIKLPDTSGQRRIGRNEPCTCGSGKKYKHCHGRL